MIRSRREPNESSGEQTLLRVIYDAVHWTYLSDRLAIRMLDPHTIVYPSHFTEFVQSVGAGNGKMVDPEAIAYDEAIAQRCAIWEYDFKLKFIDFETSKAQTEDYSLNIHVQSWMNLSKHAALGRHSLFLEDVSEICGHEQPQEDRDDVLTDMKASGRDSLHQARLTWG